MRSRQAVRLRVIRREVAWLLAFHLAAPFPSGGRQVAVLPRQVRIIPGPQLCHIQQANGRGVFGGVEIGQQLVNERAARSLAFADGVERQFKKHAKRSSRGVKQAGFLVLWQTAMPSILIEAGFLSNVEEEKYLNTEEGQEEIAESIFRAFQQYKKDVEANN